MKLTKNYLTKLIKEEIDQQNEQPFDPTTSLSDYLFDEYPFLEDYISEEQIISGGYTEDDVIQTLFEIYDNINFDNIFKYLPKEDYNKFHDILSKLMQWDR